MGNACRSCNAAIAWMRTSTGKAIPVDLDGQPLTTAETAFDPKVHIAHFATCPNADQHRKGRR